MDEVYYSGCNSWENHGANEFEPVGTATAMHECGDCERLPYCKVKQTSDVFPFNAEEFEKDWKETQEIAKSKK